MQHMPDAYVKMICWLVNVTGDMECAPYQHPFLQSLDTQQLFRLPFQFLFNHSALPLGIGCISIRWIPLQVTGTAPVFKHPLAIFRAISTVLLMDAANDYLSVLRTSRGGLRRDSAVFFAGSKACKSADCVWQAFPAGPIIPVPFESQGQGKMA